MVSSIWKKKVLPSAMAVAMTAGFALSNSAQAVYLDEDGTGQVLLAPYYSVLDGWKTKVTIINTRADVAVKAKVVIRSKDKSTEVLDFLCYLSPADVCRFEIRNKNGQAALYSDDDSIKLTGNFASIQPVYDFFESGNTSDFGLTIFDHNLEANDINEVGHIEIIAGYAAKGTVLIDADDNNVAEDRVDIYRGMTKPRLATLFDVGRPNNRATLANWPANNEAAIGTASLVQSANPAWIQLQGYVEMVKDDASDRMGYRIPALDGGANDNQLAFYDGRVISNPSFDVFVSDQTQLGAGFARVLGTPAGDQNNILELEAALAKTSVSGSYEDDSNSAIPGINRTAIVTSFVTKYAHDRATICAGDDDVYLRYSAPFGSDALGSVEYGVSSFDNQERIPGAPIQGPSFDGSGAPVAPIADPRSLPSEVNYFKPSWPSDEGINFESGWFNLSFTAEPGCPYAGVPAIVYMHKYNEAGGMFNSWFVQTGDH